MATNNAFGTVPAEVVAGDAAHVIHTYGRLPVEFVGGNGVVLRDSEGNEYLDFLAGIGCVCLGHEHPALVNALKSQADKIWQVGNYYYVENRNELAAKVSELLSCTTDEKGHVTGSTGTQWKMFFSNSGAESNEGAIKLARKYSFVGMTHIKTFFLSPVYPPLPSNTVTPCPNSFIKKFFIFVS